MRRRGRDSIVESGVLADPILAGLVAGTRRDRRHGANVIARPPAAVIEHVVHLQDSLRAYEPNQYYYPPDDLHVTLLTVRSGRTAAEADTVAATLRELLPGLAATSGPLELDTALLAFDAQGCALNFLPSSSRLQSFRQRLRAGLAERGIAVDLRYPPRSAHVTFLRYVHPLRSDRLDWTRRLLAVAPRDDLRWSIRELWTTWGRNWYGMLDSLHQAGPYPLAAAPDEGTAAASREEDSLCR